MTRTYAYFNLTCPTCGNEGAMATWSDEFDRRGFRIIGFVGKVKKNGPDEQSITCKKCGAGNIRLLKVQTRA